MNLKKYKIFLITIIILLLNCTNENNIDNIATGKVSEIGICASLNVYSQTEKTILNALYEEMFLPVRESIFTTLYVSLEKLRIYKKSKNLIFITNINRNDKYSKLINGFLNEANMEDVKREKAMMFQIFDGFAKGQNILIIAGVNEEAINKLIEINAKNIVRFFKNNSYRSIEKMVYITGENKKLEKKVYEKTKINIKIPTEYVSSFYDKDMNIYSIISHYPDRVITMGYLKKSYNFNYETIVAIRDSIGKLHWNGDLIDTLFVKLKIDTIDFGKYKAIEVIGVWSNSEKNYGGPFISYLIDMKDKYLYFDGHILLPGERKFFKLMELKTVIFSAIGDSIE